MSPALSLNEISWLYNPSQFILKAMTLVISVLQLLFALFMLCIIGLFLFSLLMSWSWANSQKEGIKLREIVSMAGVEWGSMIILLFGHLFPPGIFYHAPPLSRGAKSSKQIPIIFVPSLHTGSAIFFSLIWRLKIHHYTSLWPFSWKSFLRSPTLLEDNLANHINKVLDKTQSSRFRIVSFGTSRPLVSRLLSRTNFKKACDKWIAISAPGSMSKTMRFLTTSRMNITYSDLETCEKKPDVLVHGTHDTYCFPSTIWDVEKRVSIRPIGHYGTLLHSVTVRTILEEIA